MRLVKVNAPSGEGEKLANIALNCGVPHVTVHQARVYKKRSEELKDIVEFNCETPVAKKFIDLLTTAPFYSTEDFSFSIRQPRTIFTGKMPFKLTIPIFMPTTDVYQELWQFSHVNISFVVRIAIAAMLVSYGMIHDHLLLLIAGLLFLPLQTALLAVAFGACTREWRLMLQGLYATATAVFLTVGAGVFVAIIAGPPLQFQTFSSPMASFLISIILGVAAALATADDVGRRELIGLAVTAQVSVLPAWMGISLIFGFPDGDLAWKRLLTFLIIMGTIILTAAIAYRLMGMKGEGIRNYVECTRNHCPAGRAPTSPRTARV